MNDSTPMAKVTDVSVDTRKKVYFAHPMQTYGKAASAFAQGALAKHFPWADWIIVNPEEPQHQRAAKLLDNPFEYFSKLVASCDAICYLPFADGKIGYGIQGEAEAFRKAKPTGELFEIDRTGPEFSCKKVDELDASRLLNRRQTACNNSDGEIEQWTGKVVSASGGRQR